jgi:Domain of unknown function (DUF4124)
MRSVLIGIVLAALAPAAGAQNVYRCTDAKGRITFTDDPTAGNCTLQRVDVPPQQGAPRAPGLSDAEKKLLEQANRRAAELDRAAADIVTAFNALRAAEARRDQGIEPLEGERSGRRFRPEYWQRRQALDRDVQDARARLDEALERRNALR